MSNIVNFESKFEQVIMKGDLAVLTSDERMIYINKICSTLGLNAMTRPFEYLVFQGKTILYARKDCTEQLRKIHGVGIIDLQINVVDGICIAKAHARDKDGKEDFSTGAVNVEGLNGEAKANAMMKAETKAKRRVTLSICGLGMLDESEFEKTNEHEVEPQAQAQAQVVPQIQEKEINPPELFESSFDDQHQKMIDDLFLNFRKLGVSVKSLMMKIGKPDSFDPYKMTHQEIESLKGYGNQITKNKIPVREIFPVVNYAPK